MTARVDRLRGVLRIGDGVRLRGDDHVVIGMSGALVRLRDAHGAESVTAITALQADPEFALVRPKAAPTVAAAGLLSTIPAPALERARWWERHILDVEQLQPAIPLETYTVGAASARETGQEARPRGERTDAEPQLVVDLAHPSHTEASGEASVAERERAKLAELAEAGVDVGLRTLRRYRHNYARFGLVGLVDHRSTVGVTSSGRTDPRVVTAVRQAMIDEVDASSGTRSRLLWKVQNLLDARYGPGEVTLPSQATMYRLLTALESGRHTFGAATTRRSLAKRPHAVFGSVLVSRPGELTQIDTNTLDVMALLDDGVPARVEMTILVDVATRTIMAALLRPRGTRAIDAAMLLARAMVPEQMRPGWPGVMAMRSSVLPAAELAEVDQATKDAVGKPVITPEAVVFDHGKIFVSEVFQSACNRLGISLLPAHKGTPTDKPVVERTFQSVNTLFCQYVQGYVGRDPSRRGRELDDQPLFTIRQLQELLDQWIVLGWQNRRHSELRHPEMPRVILTPNEMWSVQIAAAGYLPMAMSAGDYLELLPVKWRLVGPGGVEIDTLLYDCDALGAMRGERSPYRHRNGRWPVYVDPYDMRQVWVRDPRAPHDPLDPRVSAWPDTDDTGPGTAAEHVDLGTDTAADPDELAPDAGVDAAATSVIVNVGIERRAAVAIAVRRAPEKKATREGVMTTCRPHRTSTGGSRCRGSTADAPCSRLQISLSATCVR